MDFDLTEELQILRLTVRRFVDKELIPLEREYRPEGEEMPEHLLRPLHARLRWSETVLLLICQKLSHGANLICWQRSHEYATKKTCFSI